jgi:methionyl-tRNA formyltransferase
MRLAFMGTPDFALPTLRALIDTALHEVVLVITQPDKPKGRGRQLQAPPVKQLALEMGIPVLQPERLKHNDEIYSSLTEAGLDAVIVVAYGKMIPADMLEIPRHGFINVHASLLPFYRGAAPINRAILAGEPTTGVSIMRIDAGMDSGPVFLQAETPIEESEDAEILSKRLSELGAIKLTETLELLGKGQLSPTPQDHERATYAPMLKKEEGEIDWGNDVKTIHNMIRAFVPWPCAYTYMGTKTLKIWSGSCRSETHEIINGTLVKDGARLKIACSGGFIIPHVLQLEGKKAMESNAFSCGIHESRMMLGKGEFP